MKKSQKDILHIPREYLSHNDKICAFAIATTLENQYPVVAKVIREMIATIDNAKELIRKYEKAYPGTVRKVKPC